MARRPGNFSTDVNLQGGLTKPALDIGRSRRLGEVGIKARFQRPADVIGLRISADGNEPDRARLLAPDGLREFIAAEFQNRC